MRRFACSDCHHSWDVPYGNGQSGRKMTCPQCGSNEVHRPGWWGDRRGTCGAQQLACGKRLRCGGGKKQGGH
jgi:transposase-like protein